MKKRYLVLGVGFTLVLLLIGMFIHLNSPVSKNADLYTVNITDHDTFSTIIDELEHEAVIRSGSFTKLVLKFQSNAALYVGNYELDRSWSTLEILQFLTNQNNARSETVTIQFHPYDWAKDFAEKLAQETSLSSEDILSAWDDKTYMETLAESYPFLEGLSAKEDLKIRIEGYLMPDTYEFQTNTTIDAVTRIILNHTATVLEPLYAEIEASPFTLHELMTLASIVHYEGNSEDSMQKMASVFLNRLDINMTLGSCATVCYALYNYSTWQECAQNTDIDSIYNSYIHPGLTPGPIMNPSKTAILAVLRPIQTDYLYFVSDVATGESYYARTYAEHLENVRIYVDPQR